MIRAASDDPAGVDELVAAIAPGLAGLGLPVINRPEVVLVTGPWLAGVSGVRAALAERLPQRRFVETAELGPGDAPVAVVFVVSAATALTESDCVLLDTAAEHTDAVVAVVSKIDVHRGWRDVLTSNRDRLAARASRYARVPWVGAAAAPELGEPYLDDLVAAIQKQLADPAVARRNMLRAWESRLLMVARRFDGDAQSAGRRARVDALRQQRRTVLRQGRQSKSEHTIALRAQIQHARVKLSYFARNRCSLLRVELQEHVAGLSRKDIARFAAYTRGRVQEVVAEVGEGAVAHLADVAAVGCAGAATGPREPPGGAPDGCGPATDITTIGDPADNTLGRRVRAGYRADPEQAGGGSYSRPGCIGDGGGCGDRPGGDRLGGECPRAAARPCRGGPLDG